MKILREESSRFQKSAPKIRWHHTLYPISASWAKIYETNALVINQVCVCSILKPGDNVQLSTGNVTEVNVTAGRAVGKKQTLVPRDWRPLNNTKS